MILKKVAIAVVLCMLLAISVSAQQRGTPEEAKMLVEKAIAYIKANGQEKAFAEFNNPKGKFVDRDLYITVYDLKGNCLARGANPELLGKNLMNSKDPDGKNFIKERMELAKAQPSGWQDYKFMNPVTKTVEYKKFYFERYNDLIVGCGAYPLQK
jgi:hypothetical protein